MSRKKSKTVNKNLLANSHLESEIRENQLVRSLKIKVKQEFTKKQKDFIAVALNEDTQLMFVDGPAGTAKTYLSVYCGLELLQKGKLAEMIYTRSAVESSD